MTTTPQSTYRTHTTPPTDKVTYRQPDNSEDGVFEVRMPIATTGEVRNQGDDPLTRSELSGMARQINDRSVGVFFDHGGTSLGGMERYSAVEKVGEWREAEVSGEQAEDGPTELVATARLMDPESLPSGVGDLRAALGSIKEQVKRDFSVSASIGWREDDSYPGGNDLMEASIVGIGADPRTTSEASEAGVVARAAVEAGADPDALLDAVRDAVESERPLGPEDDPDRFESFEECVASLTEDGELSEAEAERVCGAWENANSAEHDSVTEDSDTPADEGGTTNDSEQDAQDPDEEFREFMREQQEQQTELLRTLTESLREDMEDGEDEDDEEQEMDEDEEDDDDEEEQSADTPDGEQDADEDSDLKERIAELEDELAAVRSGEGSVESPGDGESETEQDAETTTTATSEKWGRHRN
jgi:hypothetical protein